MDSTVRKQELRKMVKLFAVIPETKKIPVKRRVLLRQAYVTIKIGPKMG
jgi:hypothetical protein